MNRFHYQTFSVNYRYIYFYFNIKPVLNFCRTLYLESHTTESSQAQAVESDKPFQCSHRGHSQTLDSLEDSLGEKMEADEAGDALRRDRTGAPCSR